MNTILKPVTWYLKPWKRVIDTGTTKDAWYMLILSILLLIAGVADLLHLLP